ncbi:hypothetical protein TNCV_827621 [Trichonephila clavipes]|nr:hypothetical protein TNCV_827621 [Trichonephila clavipes]
MLVLCSDRSSPIASVSIPSRNNAASWFGHHNGSTIRGGCITDGDKFLSSGMGPNVLFQQDKARSHINKLSLQDTYASSWHHSLLISGQSNVYRRHRIPLLTGILGRTIACAQLTGNEGPSLGMPSVLSMTLSRCGILCPYTLLK